MTKDTFPMNIGGGKVRSERMLLAKVENGKNMMSADSVRFLYCIARLADAIRTIVWNSCAVTIRLVGL